MRALPRLAVVIMLVAIGLTSCRAPTQVTLVVSTDVSCRDMKRLAITVATPETAERLPPTTASDECHEGGDLGTLVVIPGAGKTSAAGIKVVLGVYRNAEECTPENGYKGCIVARRSLHFIRATPLELPVRLYLACEGVPCDENSTCNRRGQCVPAMIADPEDCAPPNRCYPAGEDPDDLTDGGLDASFPVLDGETRDASNVSDAKLPETDASDAGCTSQGNAWAP